MPNIAIDDAVRPAGPHWGIFRVRAVTAHRVLVEADDYLEWVPRGDVVYLHTPARWVGWETD